MLVPRGSLSSEIAAKVALISPWLREASRQLLGHPTPSRLYPEYLRVMHGISRAAVPLMTTAVTRLERDYRGEVLTPTLVTYFEHHIEEEQNHDRWILEDLECLGIDPSWTLRALPLLAIVALVGSQYYWIEHHHPAALLGYLSVMESSQPSPESVARLQ